jgi:hypothetical protein
MVGGTRDKVTDICRYETFDFSPNPGTSAMLSPFPVNPAPNSCQLSPGEIGIQSLGDTQAPTERRRRLSIHSRMPRSLDCDI